MQPKRPGNKQGRNVRTFDFTAVRKSTAGLQGLASLAQSPNPAPSRKSLRSQCFRSVTMPQLFRRSRKITANSNLCTIIWALGDCSGREGLATMRVMKERRAHRRVPVGFGAEVHTGAGMIPAMTRDLSRGGCQFITDAALPEGQLCVIELKLTIDGIWESKYPALRVSGRVRWVAEGEDGNQPVFLAGFQFEGLSDAQGSWLEAVIEKYGNDNT